jgi:hypothetical protein
LSFGAYLLRVLARIYRMNVLVSCVEVSATWV